MAIAFLSARLHAAACDLTPRATISAVVLSSPARPRAQIETAAPASANASAIDRPIPLLPPATTARLPRKFNCIDALLRATPPLTQLMESPTPQALLRS